MLHKDVVDRPRIILAANVVALAKEMLSQGYNKTEVYFFGKNGVELLQLSPQDYDYVMSRLHALSE